MEENISNGQTSRIGMKELKLAGIIILGLLILFNIYWFGFRGLTNYFYNKGYTVGFNTSQQQNSQVVVQQLCQTGQLGVNLPKGCDLSSSETMPVILIPKISTSTK